MINILFIKIKFNKKNSIIRIIDTSSFEVKNKGGNWDLLNVY